VYAETLRWEESVAFWEGIGFTFVDRSGSDGHRAGRLEAADAAVVLAEITDGTPAFTVFFALDDPEHFVPGRPVDLASPLEDTHWGTRWLRVRDLEGRIHALEGKA